MIDWILDPRHVALAGWILGLGTPLAAACFAASTPARRRRCRQSGFFWIVGASGPLLVALWFVFNRIVEIFGLDSFPGLLIHLLFFSLAGILIGALLRWSVTRKAAEETGKDAQRDDGAPADRPKDSAKAGSRDVPGKAGPPFTSRR